MRRRPLLAIACVFAATAAAPQGDPNPVRRGKPYQRTPPARLALYLGGGIFPPNYQVELKGDTLVYTAETHNPADPNGKLVKTTKTVKPTPQQWQGFRKAVEEAHVWNWKPRYENKAVLDGTRWSVVLDWSGRRVESSGHMRYPDGKGAYPKDERAAAASGVMAPWSPEFERLRAGVEELVGEPFK